MKESIESVCLLEAILNFTCLYVFLMIGFLCEWLNIFVKFAFAYFLLGKLPMQAVGREKRLIILECAG